MNFSERNFQRYKILVSVYLLSPFLHTYLPSQCLAVLYFLHLPGSEIAVYEGDILLRRGRRSAINCESCLWPKSQDGLVKVPVNISSDFCECMQMDALKLALIFQPLYSLLFYVSVACTKSNLCTSENLLTRLFFYPVSLMEVWLRLQTDHTKICGYLGYSQVINCNFKY